MSPRTASRILVAPDPLSAELALVGELGRLAEAEPLARKTVVVPSHSLRVALLARLAGLRSAWLGLEVVTLRGMARAILERSGAQQRSGDALLPIVVERLARRERALARPLETLIDGFAGAQGAIRDLLDAGFGEEHLEFALERIEAERTQLGGDALDRAAALCRIAAASRRELVALGLSVDADLYIRATENLAADPDRALPASALFLHGFADATGVASDLLTEIARQRPTLAILLDPWELDGESRGSWRFGRRLTERLQGIADFERLDVAPRPARLTLFAAADPAREARAAVARLAGPIAAGERPEELAIVIRDPAPYRALLAREIDRQALPASGADGPPSPLGRRARGLLELVLRQGDASLSLAFAVAGEFLARGSGARPWELRLGALALGARRLSALAQLEVAQETVRLPLQDRFVERSSAAAVAAAAVAGELDGEAETAAADSRLSVRSRALPAEALRRATRQAAALLTRLEAQNRRQPLNAALAGITSLVATLVVAEEDRQALLAPLAALTEAAQVGRTKFEITAAEAAQLLRDAWQEVGAAALGGAGGGAAVLSVTEARGRTFRRIVLAGLTRDRFPRAIRSDPFLPDSLRLRLRDLLPDLPVKSEGHDEERFLFAQLLGAAPEIDLFFAHADEEAKPLSPSSFLAELRRAGRLGDALPALEPALPSALDLACRTALAGESAQLTAALAKAYDEGGRRFPAAAPEPQAGERWAASHIALLAELGADPLAPQAARLGPFFGFAGARPEIAGGSDPRRATPGVTTLQSLAGCGWRTFLGKLLRLAAPPAGEDEIPELPPRLTGTVVHLVLERMAPPVLREVRTVADAEAHEGIEVPWPDNTQLRVLVATASREALTDEGLDTELFALPLELAASEVLAVVRRLDWGAGSRSLLGLEVEGTAALDLPLGARSVSFRADRVERVGEALLLTDYKTGKSELAKYAKAETRRRKLEEALAEGDWLQLPAYARARAGRPVEGRLLFLKSDLEDDRREALSAAPAEATNLDRSERAVWQTLFTAWDRGTFLPRLLDKSLEAPYKECAYCEVRVACLQGDSGARLRLERWVRARLERAGAASSAAPGGRPDGSDESDGSETTGAEAADEAAWQLFQLRGPSPPAGAPEGD